MSFVLGVVFTFALGSVAQPGSHSTGSIITLPLRFEPTAEPGFDFEAIGASFRTFIRPGLLEIRLRGPEPNPSTFARKRPLRSDAQRPGPPETIVRMHIEGSDPAALITGEAPFPGVSNYYRGADPGRWRVRVPHYGRLRCSNIYPGIDLLLYGTASTALEYDFVVAPGVDPRVIQLAFSGHETLQIDPSGNLAWNTPLGRVQHHRPVIYQEFRGVKTSVEGGYTLRTPHSVGFEITGPYNRTLPLIIDPQVTFSSFVGGSLHDNAYAVAVDAARNTYIAGFSGSFPAYDSYVAKVNADGTAFEYWTVHGGNDRDLASDLVARSDGRVVVTGWTASDHTSFPIVLPALQSQLQGPFDGFLFALDPTGALVYSTYLGGAGEDFGTSVALGPSGDLYVLGESNSAVGFPGNPNPPEGSQDIFVTRLRISETLETEVRYALFFGSPSTELAGWQGIAVDRQEHAYVTGTTRGDVDPSFPTTPFNVAQPSSAGEEEGFLAKFSPTGAVVYSTLLGGDSYDYASSVAVDVEGAAYVGGHTESASFPFAAGTPGPDKTLSGLRDNFILKISPSGLAFEMFTFVGGSSWECTFCYTGPSVAVTDEREVLFAGDTSSVDLPVTANAPQPSNGGGVDATFGKVSADGSTFEFLTYYGGSGDDCAQDVALSLSDGTAHYAGFAALGFPQVHALQPFGGGGRDFFLTRVSFDPAPELEISPATTRWKPQWSNDPISIHFSGPADLALPGLATIEVYGPVGLVPIPPAPIGGAFPNYVVSWTGPWVYMDGSTERRLPARNYPTRLVAAAGVGPTAREVKSPLFDRISLVEVKSVALTEVPSGAALDSNPSVGGGKRIFAEADTEPSYGEPVPPVVDVIGVTVSVEPEIDEPVPVHVRSVDVDDPSASGPPIDPPVSCDRFGCDNIETIATGHVSANRVDWVPGSAGIQVTVPPGSEATAYFRSSKRQGDNYRIVPSTTTLWLDGLQPVETDFGGALQHSTGASVVEGQHMAEMLTVWRTLHVEVDRLVTANPEDLQGSMEHRGNYTDLTATSLVDTVQSFLTPFHGAGHEVHDGWRRGIVTLDAAPFGYHQIASNTTNTINVIPGTFPPPDGNTRYAVYDDELASIDLVASTTLAASLLQAAYIRLEEQAQTPGESEVIFTLKHYRHMPDPGTAAAQKLNAETYWSVQLFNAFDGASTVDRDPEDETQALETWLGATHHGPVAGSSLATKVKAAVHLETIRDLVASPPPVPLAPRTVIIERTAAHELLHTLGLVHDGAIMCADELIKNAPSGGQILPSHVRLLRQATEPLVNPPVDFCP